MWPKERVEDARQRTGLDVGLSSESSTRALFCSLVQLLSRKIYFGKYDVILKAALLAHISNTITTKGTIYVWFFLTTHLESET